MRARVLSALVLAPLAIVLTALGGLPFALGVLVMAAIAAWEAFALLAATAAVSDAGRWRWGTAVCVAVPLLVAALHPAALGAAAALTVLGSLTALLAMGAPARHSVVWACTVASAVYIAGLAIHFTLLRETSHGLQWVILACAVTWSTDIGAFFCGRRFGHTPFFQQISPNKTREGAIGGLAAGVVACLLVGVIAHLAPIAALLAVGITASAAGQAGDLLESLLKREAKVKDSGTIIPGHGGMLDRIDSLLVVVTLVFYWRLLFP